MLEWIGRGCLGPRLPLRNPLVDSAGDGMVCAISDLFVIGHPRANMNKWVEVVVAKAELAPGGHIRLGYSVSNKWGCRQ